MRITEMSLGRPMDDQGAVLAARRALRRLTWIAFLVLSLGGLTGCLNTPSNESVDPLVAAGIPDHTAFGNTPCVTCHEVDRPPPTIQAGTGIPAVHGDGRDCGECHVAGAANWRTFVAFSHSPVPATCTDCHHSAQPTALVNQMLHTYPGVGDCVACHAADAGVTWTNGTYDHQPIPSTCVECHAAERPTTVVNGFSHDIGGTGDCAACHHSVGATWADGYFSHSPAPTNCLDCHASDRPAGAVGPAPGFDHAAANGAGLGDCRSCHIVFSSTQTDWSGGSYSHVPEPTTCIDCHLGKRPVGLVGTPPFDHANGGTGDCASCHTVTTAHPVEADWAGGTFSHVPAPASCIGCHVGDRPAAPVGTPAFDHSIAGMGDCKSCHLDPGGTWAGGQFDHIPAPTSCIDCHLAQRPLTLTSSGFNHSLNGTGDCAECHHNPGVSWTGAANTFDHNTLLPATRCDSCHAAQRPAAANNVPWSIPLPPNNPNRPNLFLHSVMATTDCKGCHLDPGGAWAGGQYEHVPPPVQCSVCHVNQRPVGVFPGTSFDHQFGGMGDCGACHTVKANWSGAIDFSHSPVPTSCIGCHVGDRPTGTVGTNPPFNHASNNGAGLGDCKICHLSPGVTWTGGVISHSPRPTTCAGCHGTQKPAAAVRSTNPVVVDGQHYVNDYLHSLVAGDCAACHAGVPPQASDWTGGKYSHSPAPASCTTCHAITKPTVVVAGFDHSQAGLGDCKGCHLSPGVTWTGATAIPTRVTITPPTGRNWPTITAAHPVIDSAKSGLTCTTCHGTNTSAMIVAYDHAFPVAGIKCVYCHYTGQTETSFKVTTRTHESTSNNKDCNISGCHRPSLPTWNATTAKFTGGRWGEP